MKNDIIYIEGKQQDVPDRNDNIIVRCGTKGTWGYKEITVSKYDCITEKELRNKYSKLGLSAYSTKELLEEVMKRIED